MARRLDDHTIFERIKSVTIMSENIRAGNPAKITHYEAEFSDALHSALELGDPLIRAVLQKAAEHLSQDDYKIELELYQSALGPGATSKIPERAEGWYITRTQARAKGERPRTYTDANSESLGAVLIHELTHFVLDTIYRNDALPYADPNERGITAAQKDARDQARLKVTHLAPVFLSPDFFTGDVNPKIETWDYFLSKIHNEVAEHRIKKLLEGFKDFGVDQRIPEMPSHMVHVVRNWADTAD